MTHELHMRALGHRAIRYAGITLGCLIASCSINLFLIPAHLLTGGDGHCDDRLLSLWAAHRPPDLSL